MGNHNALTKNQALIFSEVAADDFLRAQFYFTGGTALSAFYLYHRESEDLDFFSKKEFPSEEIVKKVSVWAKKYSFQVERRQIENVHVYNLQFPNGEILKVDFVNHPYKSLEEGKIVDGIRIDSLSDIATNKLLTINQRTQVKDFVDLYFLLEKYTVWDLMEGMRIKYSMKTEPFFIASDFLKIEDFEFLPKMIKPLTLEQLQTFFREKAKEIGIKAVE